MEKSKVKTGKTDQMITIKLTKGLMRCTEDQIATVKGLGLRRTNDFISLENTPSVRGMIKKVIHLLEIVSER